MSALISISELLLVPLGIAILVAATAWFERNGGEPPPRRTTEMPDAADQPAGARASGP